MLATTLSIKQSRAVTRTSHSLFSYVYLKFCSVFSELSNKSTPEIWVPITRHKKSLFILQIVVVVVKEYVRRKLYSRVESINISLNQTVCKKWSKVKITLVEKKTQVAWNRCQISLENLHRKKLPFTSWRGFCNVHWI